MERNPRFSPTIHGNSPSPHPIQIPSSWRTRKFKSTVQNFLHLRKPTPRICLCRTRNVRLIRCSAGHRHHTHQHHHDHKHDGHHHHGHSHGLCGGCDAPLTRSQEILFNFAKFIKWADLANFLREHLELSCCSAALFLATAACLFLLPKPAVRAFQQTFTFIAFPLVGVSASFDALMDIMGGKTNIHVLMALAAFASVFMGNALEGGMLIAMFNLSHIAEEYFTSRSKIDVNELKENHPEFALLLDVKNGELPSFSSSIYREVLVTDLAVGSYLLVKTGEVLLRQSLSLHSMPVLFRFVGYSFLLLFLDAFEKKLG